MSTLFKLNQIKSCLKLVKGKGLTGEISRGGLGSVIIKVANIALGFFVSIVLSRTLGVEGYGIYSFAFAAVSVLVIPVHFGLPTLVIRETAKAEASRNWAKMRGMWVWATFIVCSMSGLIIIITLLIIPLWGNTSLQNETLLWGTILVFLLALGALRGASLRGLRFVVLGQLPETVLRPFFFIVLLLVSYHFVMTGSNFSPITAMQCHVIAAGASFVIGAWLLYSKCPLEIKKHCRAEYDTKIWFFAAWPLALAAAVRMILNYTDIMMIGFLLHSTDVALYRIAMQGALLATIGLQIITMFILPYISRLHAQDDFGKIQQLAYYCAWCAFIFAFIVLMFFFFWGEEAIIFVFGIDYISAFTPLLILVIGYLVNAAFGTVGVLLSMCGCEKQISINLTCALVVNVLLNSLLIPLFGINGAAFATVLSLVLSGGMLWLVAWNRLGINSSIIRKGPYHKDKQKVIV